MVALTFLPPARVMSKVVSKKNSLIVEGHDVCLLIQAVFLYRLSFSIGALAVLFTTGKCFETPAQSHSFEQLSGISAYVGLLPPAFEFVVRRQSTVQRMIWAVLFLR